MEDRISQKTIMGGVLLSAASLFGMSIGLLYWFLLARITGIKSIGAASAIVSSALIPASIIGAGFGLAVAREVAKNPSILRHLIRFSVLLGFLSSLIALLLAYILYKNTVYALLASIMGFFIVTSEAGLKTLIGLEEFKYILAYIVAANLAKVLAGTYLALIGLDEVAVVTGYMLLPLLTSALSIARLVRTDYWKSPSSIDSKRRLLSLGLSNTLFTSSNQLPISLGVYLFAAIGGDKVATGTLYLGIMASMALATLPISMSMASLPESMKREKALAWITLLPGLSVVMPILAVLVLYPEPLFGLISREFLQPQYLDILLVLLLASPFFAVLNVGLVEFNRRASTRAIAVIAASRLSTLLVLLPLLTLYADGIGAAVAYFASIVVAVLVLIVVEKNIALILVKILSTLSPLALLLLQIPMKKITTLLLVVVLSHILLYSYTDLLKITKKLAKSIFVWEYY